MSNQEHEIYRQQIRQAIALRDGKEILNGNVDHASIIIQEAFKNAKKNIRILTSKLDPECYGRPGIIEAAKNFLFNVGHRLQILVEAPVGQYDWKNHEFIKDLKGYIEDGRLEIKSVPEKWSQSYKYNFLLLDDYGYRFEPDRSGPVARAAFMPQGKTETAAHLGGIFTKIWEGSPDNLLPN